MLSENDAFMVRWWLIRTQAFIENMAKSKQKHNNFIIERQKTIVIREVEIKACVLNWGNSKIMQNNKMLKLTKFLIKTYFLCNS